MSSSSNENDLLLAYKENELALLRYGDCCRIFLIVLTVLLVLAATGAAIASLVINAQGSSVNRFCLELGTQILGRLQLTSKFKIEYEFQYHNISGVILSVQIKGPIPPGVDTGPLGIELCGSISGAACDITTEMNKVSGKLLKAEPGSTSLKPVISALRKEPWRYYVSINTSTATEYRMPLTQVCGTAI